MTAPDPGDPATSPPPSSHPTPTTVASTLNTSSASASPHSDTHHPLPAEAPEIREPRHVPLVQVIRGGLVEGVHHGSAVVLAADGRVLVQAGDPDVAFYPRSALKPVQAVAMARAGLPLDGELLALTAASHSGQQRHLAGARRILEQGRLAEDLLRNVPDLPYGAPEREAWLRAGRGPSRLAQNCSGKHAAMLLTAQLCDWPLEGYLDPAHPLQRLIAETVEDLTGQRIARVTVDGCGAPLFAVSPRGLARALARIATAPAGTPEGRVAAAMREHPEMVAGTGRDVARLMRAVPGLIAKDGFEGVQVAALPDGSALAVKIADGADRARMPVTAAALAHLGIAPERLTEFAEAPVLGGGRPVGTLHALNVLSQRLA
ncbi:asparaginase [Streptomyces sparsogenes]|uniref:asparaginase n=1 Tax=Streptomyces sparsogenes TaxID=67365 RepID=UPI0009A09488|nr:asparaginase [Streptomyces sparsogenes]